MEPYSEIPPNDESTINFNAENLIIAEILYTPIGCFDLFFQKIKKSDPTIPSLLATRTASISPHRPVDAAALP
ncbi:hypothetical protein A2U01_0034693 [Trifolium medium]|uniref:Uncharacterized protein n=1 Tax=Trifolium medium TaxID=97028 RepID=A0A392PRP1_9FABA|nr:hypothetical protein [Trifolium medium]